MGFINYIRSCLRTCAMVLQASHGGFYDSVVAYCYAQGWPHRNLEASNELGGRLLLLACG